jgi:hypothetical protein
MWRLVLVAAVLFAGCTTASVSRVGDPLPARPETSFVSVYASQDAPYDVMRHPTVEGGRPPGVPIARMKVAMFVLSPIEGAVRYARRKALELGGHSVYVGKWEYFAQWYTLRGELDVTVYKR